MNEIIGLLSLLITVVIGGLFKQVSSLGKRISKLEHDVEDLQRDVEAERERKSYLLVCYNVLLVQAHSLCSALRSALKSAPGAVSDVTLATVEDVEKSPPGEDLLKRLDAQKPTTKRATANAR